MIFKPKMLGIISIVIGLFTISMVYSKIEDSDYKTALSIGENKFSSFKINRNEYKLIEIKNDILKSNAEQWKLTYLAKSCISKEGLRNCKGGEVFITVNIKTGEASVGWGE